MLNHFGETKMNPLVRSVILACVLMLSLSTLTYSQQVASIGELRNQINKLAAIDGDPATPSEVKAINSKFLEERRSQLRTLLQKRLDALRAYQKGTGGVLNSAESQLVTKAIADIEEELGGEAGATVSTSTPPVES